jgi:hypothetical protein
MKLVEMFTPQSSVCTTRFNKQQFYVLLTYLWDEMFVDLASSTCAGKNFSVLRNGNCYNTIRHREVPIRLIFSVARLYMLVIPDYISKSFRSGDARVALRLVSVCLSVCRLFHFHTCILVTSQRSLMLMTLFPLHSRCVRRRHVHIIL